MKAGLTTSVVIHAAALGFGLFSLSEPREMIAADMETFPVDIVPIEEFSQSVQGDREAEVAETPAPVPTTRPEPVENAQNVGDNTVDLTNAPTPTPVEREVETAAVPPPPPPEPEPQVEPEPEPEPEIAPPPPEPEPAEAAAPAEEPTPEPAPQQEAVALPQSAPLPTQRPREQPRTETAQTPERPREEPRPEPQQAQETSESVEDQVAALLNQDRPSGGGAERSSQEAALGGRNTTGARLSQSEIDALRAQVQRCWNPPVGIADAENMVVSIRIRLAPDGALETDPQVVAGGGSSIAERAAADAARRAVLRCAPFNAPSEKYEAWADVQFNFDPRDMF